MKPFLGQEGFDFRKKDDIIILDLRFHIILAKNKMASLALIIIVLAVILFAAAKTMDSNQNAAKFAFFYLLSLVALTFTSVSVGMIIFQIINKTVADPLALSMYQPGQFSSGALRFAISALIIAAPIFYLTIWQIFKNLKDGSLGKDSGVRKWLTYFILLVSIIVMIGWLIATLNNFLNGELTVKFILKALTSILISAVIFSFYFYDIRRKEVEKKKDSILQIYFYGSLVLVVAALTASFFYIESPATVRARNHDRQVAVNLDQVDSAINSYFNKSKSVPEKLGDLFGDVSREIYLTEDSIKDPQTGKEFEYKKKTKDSYEICADFSLSNKAKDSSEQIDPYIDQRWQHDAGRQCFTKKAEEIKNPISAAKPINQ